MFASVYRESFLCRHLIIKNLFSSKVDGFQIVECTVRSENNLLTFANVCCFTFRRLWITFVLLISKVTSLGKLVECNNEH